MGLSKYKSPDYEIEHVVFATHRYDYNYARFLQLAIGMTMKNQL